VQLTSTNSSIGLIYALKKIFKLDIYFQTRFFKLANIMCGVLLILSKKKTLTSEKCLKAFNLIHNRGPDISLKSFFLKKKLFIGNSILKVNGTNFQKKNLFNYKKNYISYNGEIYNHKYLDRKFLKQKQSNDTLTLLKTLTNYNTLNICKKLDGMYAFVKFNSSTNKIIFATDPQGEKKLYKYEDKNYFILSSTPKSIANFIDFKINLNYKFLNQYLHSRHFMQFRNTIFENISYIKGGIIYNLDIKNYKITEQIFDDPINWISKKNYIQNKKSSSKQIQTNFEKIFKKKLHLMLPEINFATIFSGGVDTSIIYSFLKKNKFLKSIICINNIGKDKITNAIKNRKFIEFIDYKKLKVIDVNKKIFLKLYKKTYQNFYSLLSTHDLPGRQKIFDDIKSKKLKVIFGGDGADEIFGGYEKYKNVFKDIKKVKIYSPYTRIKGNSVNKEEINDLFIRAYKKYNSFTPKKEAVIQANLFVDYFVQSVGVHNISNDVLCGENSLEMRSIFLNKDIIKFGLNLPLHLKINLIENKKDYILKPLLKKIFIKYYKKGLLFKKIGFSGFPNESLSVLKLNKQKKFKKILSKYRINQKDKIWKYLNIFLYNNYLKIKIHT
jgi:asparagine synthase (glutamine-hydrolysing)